MLDASPPTESAIVNGHRDLPNNELLIDRTVGQDSADAFLRARMVFPDGTSRTTIERDPIPRYIARGEGAYVTDIDGRGFLDLHANFTTLIHGHAFAPVIEAVQRQIRDGACFANPTEIEIELAALLCERVPHLDRVRFVNSGTEAVMFAVKAARAYTGRSAIAKIEGSYHGAYDWVEVAQAGTPDSWGPADAPVSVPYYKGTPSSVLDEVIVLRLNDAEGASVRLAQARHRLAAILIDPLPSRAGLVPLDPAFIAAVQQAARAHGILMISDEVLNFRQGYRGASARIGLEPDLITLGKIIGGGLPIGAIGGRTEIMAVFGADGRRAALPQGGTFSANPLSMAAGLAAMQALDEPAFAHLEQLGDELRQRLCAAIARRGAPFSVTGSASLFRIHPRPTPPREFREAFLAPAQALVMNALSRHFTGSGIIIPNGAAACLSTPMGEAEIGHIKATFEEFLSSRQDLFLDIAA